MDLTTPTLVNDPEMAFVEQTDRLARKRLGQFFTPRPLARLMASWIGKIAPSTVLDPAVGPGILLDACVETRIGEQLWGVDIDPAAIALADARLPDGVRLFEADFLSLQFEREFDGVTSNPPYVRHHSFDVSDEVLAKIATQSRQKIGRLTNLYVYFVLKSVALLRAGGRASFLIPAEWANANYGQHLKNFFNETGYLRRAVYFSHEGLPFTDNLSTACILCIEKTQSDDPVTTHYVSGECDLSDIDALSDSPTVFTQHLPMSFLAHTKKWDALLSAGVQQHRPGSVRLGDKGRTRRGIATGDNSFFLLSRGEIERRNLPADALRRCVGKATDARRFIFNDDDFERLVQEDRRVFLFDPADVSDPATQDYIEAGEQKGVAATYLGRSRKPWYRGEQRPPSPIWITVFGRNRLKFIRNRASVRNLTAFHCFYPEDSDPLFADALVACLNSDVIARAVAKQQRVYGGGLLKIEPADILDIDVPDLRAVDRPLLERLAQALDKLDETGTVSVELNDLVEQAFEQAAAKSVRLL